MDTATSHTTKEFKQDFSNLKTKVKFIEGGLTPLPQFMDTHVNKPFNGGVKSKWNKWIEEGEAEYKKSGKRKEVSYE